MNDFLVRAQSGLLNTIGDPVAAKQIALQALANLRLRQSSALAYFDSFIVFAALSIPLAALVFLMNVRRREGAHVAAE